MTGRLAEAGRRGRRPPLAIRVLVLLVVTTFVASACTAEQLGQLVEVLGKVIQVPVRWCAVEGSPQAEGKTDGQTVNGAKLLDLVDTVNFEVSLPGALVLLVPADAPQGIPVVADPDPNSFTRGDIGVGGFAPEFSSVTWYCEQAWNRLYPNQRGVVLVNARVVIGSAGATGGAAPTTPFELWVASDRPFTGKRGDDLCGSPRNLRAEEVSGMLQLVVYDLSLHRSQPYNGSATFHPPKVLGHEAGHTLMLGHGNGLDDNGDGLLPPDPGRRRFDEYCDRQGTDEDRGTQFSECEESGSLLQANACTNLQPLQEEQAREVATLIPGAVGPASAATTSGVLIAPRAACPPRCTLSRDLVLLKTEIVEAPARGTVTLSQRVLGPTPEGATNEYVTSVDLDNRRDTGCNASTVGVPALDGIELVAAVTVSSARGTKAVTPKVWRCAARALVPEVSPEITAAAATQVVRLHDGTQETVGENVSVTMPAKVRGPAGPTVRAQAITRRLDRTNPAPAARTEGTVTVGAGVLPRCEATPRVAQPGAAVTVKGQGLGRDRDIHVFVGRTRVAAGRTDGQGSTAVEFPVPSSARGLQPVSLRVPGQPSGATCALIVDTVPRGRLRPVR